MPRPITACRRSGRSMISRPRTGPRKLSRAATSGATTPRRRTAGTGGHLHARRLGGGVRGNPSASRRSEPRWRDPSRGHAAVLPTVVEADREHDARGAAAPGAPPLASRAGVARVQHCAALRGVRERPPHETVDRSASARARAGPAENESRRGSPSELVRWFSSVDATRDQRGPGPCRSRRVRDMARGARGRRTECHALASWRAAGPPELPEHLRRVAVRDVHQLGEHPRGRRTSAGGQ